MGENRMGKGLQGPMKIIHRVLILSILLSLTVGAVSCKREAERPASSEKITIAYPLSMYSVLYQIASAKGFFKSGGLDVTPQPHAYGKATVQAMVEGRADLAISGDTVLMFSIAGGHKIGIIAENLTSKRNEAVVARKDRGITAPRHLEGRSIGVALGTTGHFFLDTFLTVNRIDKKRIKYIDMLPGQMMDALRKGSVDAVAVWQPYIKSIELGLGESGTVFYDVRIYSDMACLSGKQEYVTKHPETIKKVLIALLRAEAFVKERPDESRQIVSEALKIERNLLEGIWSDLFFQVTLGQSLLVSLEDQTRWALENRLLKAAKPNYLDFIHADALKSVKPEALTIIR